MSELSLQIFHIIFIGLALKLALSAQGCSSHNTERRSGVCRSALAVISIITSKDVATSGPSHTFFIFCLGNKISSVEASTTEKIWAANCGDREGQSECEPSHRRNWTWGHA